MFDKKKGGREMNLQSCKTPREVQQAALALGKDPKEMIDEWYLWKRGQECEKWTSETCTSTLEERIAAQKEFEKLHARVKLAIVTSKMNGCMSAKQIAAQFKVSVEVIRKVMEWWQNMKRRKSKVDKSARLERLIKKYVDGKINGYVAARKLRISGTTFYQKAKEYRQRHGKALVRKTKNKDIRDLLLQGYSTREIIDRGYNKWNVYTIKRLLKKEGKLNG